MKGPPLAAVAGADSPDERALAAGTSMRFSLVLVMLAAECAGAAHDTARRLAPGLPALGTWAPVGWLVVLAVATYFGYRAVPRWKLRRTAALAAFDDGGAFQRDLDALVRRARLRSTPRFVVETAAIGGSAVVATESAGEQIMTWAEQNLKPR